MSYLKSIFDAQNQLDARIDKFIGQATDLDGVVNTNNNSEFLKNIERGDGFLVRNISGEPDYLKNHIELARRTLDASGEIYLKRLPWWSEDFLLIQSNRLRRAVIMLPNGCEERARLVFPIENALLIDETAFNALVKGA